jgi:hypothetical protein
MRSLAAPVMKALEEAADWSKGVEPYYSQLLNLPSQLVDVAAGRETALELYVNTNPLVTGFAVSIVLGAVFLVVAEITKNYSQVDRCWSLLPTLYNAHFAAWARLAGYSHQRVDAILFWSVIWSVRAQHGCFPLLLWSSSVRLKESADPAHVQLLAAWGIPGWIRGLSMVSISFIRRELRALGAKASSGRSFGEMFLRGSFTSSTGRSSPSSRAFCSSRSQHRPTSSCWPLSWSLP